MADMPAQLEDLALQHERMAEFLEAKAKKHRVDAQRARELIAGLPDLNGADPDARVAPSLTPRVTVSDRVDEALTAAYPSSMSADELAGVLGAPSSTVRSTLSVDQHMRGWVKSTGRRPVVWRKRGPEEVTDAHLMEAVTE